MASKTAYEMIPQAYYRMAVISYQKELTGKNSFVDSASRKNSLIYYCELV